MDYRKAGVDISAGNEAARRIGELARKTFNKRVIRGIGSFGGFYSLTGLDFKKPVMVTSVDGIGTKLIVARMAGKYFNLGGDLVNHCINDIASCGAQPLFFMDYFATANLNPALLSEIVDGMTDALEKVGCPLIGGETAEMPDLYSPGDFDIAGFIVGIVDEDSIVDGASITHGDKIIVIPSNGLHTNGYTLARKALFELAGFDTSSLIEPLGSALGEELLKPHTCYLEPLQKLKGIVKGISHITGGGLIDNIIRILPENCRVKIDTSSIEVPLIFDVIQRAGSIKISEMYRVFNMGAGLAVVVDAKDLPVAI